MELSFGMTVFLVVVSTVVVLAARTLFLMRTPKKPRHKPGDEGNRLRRH